MGRQLRTIKRGAEDPDRYMRPLTRMRTDGRTRIGVAQIGHQLGHIIGEVIAATHAAAHGTHHRLIATWRTAKAQINPVAMDRSQRAELFGNRQRRMIGQHHTARTDANILRMIRHMP